MTEDHSTAKSLARVAADAALGFAAFVFLTLLLSRGADSAVFARGPGASAANLVPLGLLSVCFSLIVAFNLAILRHLRRVYASPRRGEWRRDQPSPWEEMADLSSTPVLP